MTANRRTFLKQVSALSLSPWAWGEATSGTVALPRSTPEAEGVVSAGISAFIEAMAATKHELHSFMMLRHGRVIAEGWWEPYGPQYKHSMYSMSKSFTSTAIGLLVGEGRITVEDLVVRYFPQDVPEPTSENLASLKIKHLLSMAVGNEHEPTQAVVQSEHWVKTFLEQSITHEPGSVFMYNSAATYMLSAVVTKVTGNTVLEYLTPRLFEPLGITGMTWETCPRGINTGGWGLSITTEGLAKFGQLYLQKGKWNDAQLIPSEWVKQATTFKIQQPDPAKPTRSKETNDWLQGYCYQFWRCQHDAFRGDGAFGQFTIVLPKQDAVIVMTSETKDMQGQLDLVWQHLLPSIQAKAMPPSNSMLKSKLDRAVLPPLQNAFPFNAEVAHPGKTFAIEPNDQGITGVRFEIADNVCTFTAEAGGIAHTIPCGMQNWLRSETSMPGTPPRLISGGAPKGAAASKVAASAAWSDMQTLVMVLRYYETPHHDTLTCKFDGDKLTLSFVNSMASMSGKTKDARPGLIGLVKA